MARENIEGRSSTGLDLYDVIIRAFNYRRRLVVRCDGPEEWYTLTCLLAAYKLEDVFRSRSPHSF